MISNLKTSPLYKLARFLGNVGLAVRVVSVCSAFPFLWLLFLQKTVPKFQQSLYLLQTIKKLSSDSSFYWERTVIMKSPA